MALLPWLLMSYQEIKPFYDYFFLFRKHPYYFALLPFIFARKHYDIVTLVYFHDITIYAAALRLFPVVGFQHLVAT